jgi:hypothetical protein
MANLSKNAGEWAELCVLTNTLGEGVLTMGNKKIPNPLL